MSRSIFLPILLLALALPTSANETAPSELTDDPKAREIMVKVDARDDGDMMTQKLEMVLIDKNGNERVRQLSLLRSRRRRRRAAHHLLHVSRGRQRHGFPDLRLRRTRARRRSVAVPPGPAQDQAHRFSDKSGSFMGSDFSFADMTDFDLDKYAFKMLDDGEVRGREGLED